MALIILFTLIFKAAQVPPAPVRDFVKSEPIVFNEAAYIKGVSDQYGIDINTDPPIDHLLYIEKMIVKYKLPKRLMYRLIYFESKYDCSRKSRKGAWGYMQTMPATFNEEAERLGLDSSVYSNIEVGCFYMKKILDRYNWNFELSLAAYNAGPNNESVMRGEVPDFKETKNYIRKILTK